MFFYTSVVRKGNKFLVRGIEEGRRFQEEFDYEPYLFFPCFETTGFKTLEGQNVEKRHFNNGGEAWERIKSLQKAGFKYYGLNNFLYPFINDTFPGKIKFDPTQVRVVSI